MMGVALFFRIFKWYLWFRNRLPEVLFNDFLVLLSQLIQPLAHSLVHQENKF